MIFIFCLSVFSKFFYNKCVLVFATQRGVLFQLYSISPTRHSGNGAVSAVPTGPVQF